MVVTLAAGEPIITKATVQRIRFGTAREEIITGTAIQRICASTA